MHAADVDKRHIERTWATLTTLNRSVSIDDLARLLNYTHHWTKCTLDHMRRHASASELAILDTLIVDHN